MIGYEVSKADIHQNYFFLRIMVSKCYLYFYVTQIALSLAILLSLIYASIIITVILEIVAFVLLSADVIIKCYAEGLEHFLRRVSHVMDIIILIVIFAMICLQWTHPQLIHHPQGEISFLVLALRYSIQIWRVIQLSKQSKKQIQITSLDDISLNKQGDTVRSNEQIQQ